MVRHWTQGAAYAFIGVCIVFGQNCSEKSFDFVDKASLDDVVRGSDIEYGDLSPTPEQDPISEDSVYSEPPMIPPKNPDAPPQQEEVICDPLRDERNCGENGAGLRGVVYHLSSSNFVGNRNNATLDDYIALGDRSTFDIVMSTIDVPNRAWDRGFEIADGEYIVNEDGQMLNEYFALDLYGYIGFPEEAGAKAIEVAILSDDGMRVSIGGEEVVNDDQVHAARWACSPGMVAFGAGERKTINVQWFQGPRYHIAMQLYYREVSQQSRPCNGNGGWKLFEPHHFSH